MKKLVLVFVLMGLVSCSTSNVNTKARTLSSVSDEDRDECKLVNSFMAGYLEVRTSANEIIFKDIPGIASAIRHLKKAENLEMCRMPQGMKCKIKREYNSYIINVNDTKIPPEPLASIDDAQDLLNILKSEGLCSGNINGDVKNLEETFVGRGRSSSKIPFYNGCAEAKENAVEEAMFKCKRAGFDECELVDTSKLYSKIANPIRNHVLILLPVPLGTNAEDGKCSYSVIYKGIGEPK